MTSATANASSQLSLTTALPYLSSVLTAIVAIVAIVVGRRSSKDALSNQLKQRMWEKRTDTYIEILRETLSIDPRETTAHRVAKLGSSGEKVPILPHLESSEWLEFSARVDAVASEEVRSLFSLWERCLSGWTWILVKAVIHLDPSSEAHDESKEELEKTYDAIFIAQALLTQQIRSELRFESYALPNLTLKAPEGYFGAITEIEMDKQPEVRQVPRIKSFKREASGSQWTVDRGHF